MTHTPVLVKEVLALFQTKNGDNLLDATLGQGGHAAAYLNAASGTTVVGLDADPNVLAQARANLEQFGDRVTYINANFANLNDALTGGGIVASEASNPSEAPSAARSEGGSSGIPSQFSHILFDLGLGTHQLSDPRRGFSFRGDGPLIMRYGKSDRLPDSHLSGINQLAQRIGHFPDVIELIMGLAPDQLAELIGFYGEERYARRVAKAIKEAPEPPRTARQLAEIVTAAVPAAYERGRIHPATRTFQALRLAVNRELEALAIALPQAVDLLKPAGTLAVISFHSLEDRIVKRFFRDRAHQLSRVTKKPLQASSEEVERNPRSRSAKLRTAAKNNMPLEKSTQKYDTNHHPKRNPAL